MRQSDWISTRKPYPR